MRLLVSNRFKPGYLQSNKRTWTCILLASGQLCSRRISSKRDGRFPASVTAHKTLNISVWVQRGEDAGDGAQLEWNRNNNTVSTRRRRRLQPMSAVARPWTTGSVFDAFLVGFLASVPDLVASHSVSLALFESVFVLFLAFFSPSYWTQPLGTRRRRAPSGNQLTVCRKQPSGLRYWYLGPGPWFLYGQP